MISQRQLLAAVLLMGALLVVCTAQDTDPPKQQQPEQPQQQQQQQQEQEQQEQEVTQWTVDTPRQLQPKADRPRRIVDPPHGNRPRRIVRNPIGDKGNPGTFVPTPALTVEEADAILEHHNSLRGIHQAQPLKWDDTLAAQVEDYAANCSMAHGGHAESMYVTSRVNDVAAALKDAVKAWNSEAKYYTFTEPGFSKASGHFTQLVWKSSTLLGCAAQVCTKGIDQSQPFFKKGTLVICRYLPFGNILGKFAENVAPPLGPPMEDSNFIPEGAILASPECLTSPNGKYLLCLRRDSRLQLVHSTARGNYTMWSSSDVRKAGTGGPLQAKLDTDGSLRVYDPQSTSLWSSNSTALGVGPRQLALQNDGNLVLLDANLVPVWETNTGGVMDQWTGQLSV